MIDMDKAAQRLAQAITASETVGVFGDYDVDGACSAALLTHFLRQMGCRVITHVPDRMNEGYGPNTPAIEAMIDDGAGGSERDRRAARSGRGGGVRRTGGEGGRADAGRRNNRCEEGPDTKGKGGG